MRGLFTLMLGLVISSAAFAVEAGKMTKADYEMMSAPSSNGVSKVELTMKDGSKQNFQVPFYQLIQDVDHLCMKERSFKQRKSFDDCLFSMKITNLLVAKEQGKLLTNEESKLLTDLATDSKIYDLNKDKLTPICSEKNSKGLVIITSMMPSCDSLNAKELKKAPYIDAGVSNIQLADEASKFRYKTPADVREKLGQQNLELQKKWSAME